MPIALTMMVRTWAALDAALTFFRLAPPQVKASQKFARACRRLHILMRRAGIRCRYLTVGTSASGKAMLRLQIASPHGADHSVTLMLHPGLARQLSKACQTVLEVHADEEGNPFLEYEVEELQAARDFLSELCRQTDGELPVLNRRGPTSPLTWNEKRREFAFTDWMTHKVLQLYRRVGASIN